MRDDLIEDRMEPEEQVTDTELLRRAREGDDSAFVALCGRHEAVLRARIRRHVGGALRRKLSVVDLLQETYLAAHQGLPAFEDRGEGAFRAWIARIAELKALEAVRRFVGTRKRDVGREVTHGQRPDTSMFEGPSPSPSEMAVVGEETEEVFAAMDELSEDDRRVLQLVQVEQVPFEVAATLMGRSREAVRKLYGRALARLADRLDARRRGGKP
jgi:RNA polymerase sigma-70 factor (ECF subfamily)